MRKFLFIILLFGMFVTVNAQRLYQPERGTVQEQLQQFDQKTFQINKLMETAFSKYGCRYVYGATGKNNTFDCSGFTSYVYNILGIKLSRCSRDQFHNGRQVEKHELEPGDLVFFSGRKITRTIGHVGIVTRNNMDNTFHFIHASCHGVRESHSDETYYKKRFLKACRIIE